MENRIKEQLSLFSDRLSTETLRANQLRLYFSSLAYVLVHALRRLGLRGTEWASAQVETIRLRLLKIAAQLRVTARRIWLCYSSAYPWKHVFVAAWSALRCGTRFFPPSLLTHSKQPGKLCLKWPSEACKSLPKSVSTPQPRTDRLAQTKLGSVSPPG